MTVARSILTDSACNYRVQRRRFSHTNTESLPHQPDVKVLLDSFAGKTIRIRVAKKPEMAKESLLNDAGDGDKSDESGGDSIWKSLSR